MNVYVVTNPEDGWDCVRGVFTTKRLAWISKLDRFVDEEELNTKTDAELQKLWNEHCEDHYIIHPQTLQ